MTVTLILSLVISYGNGNGANLIEMSGSGDSAVVEKSNGLHLLEINQSGKCGDKKSGWTSMEVAGVIIGLRLILVLTHICHYCYWIKSKVREKVKRDVKLELGKLDRAHQADFLRFVVILGLVVILRLVVLLRLGLGS